MNRATCAVLAVTMVLAAAREPCRAQATWPPVALPPPSRVAMRGELGQALDRGVERLGRSPYTAAWLRSDVSFEVDRIFTNYSGDVSGRFIELASLTSPKSHPRPGTLDQVLAALPGLQKPDGHFGVDIDLTKPLAKGGAAITLLWGNARLLVGLVTAARELHRPELLASAKRLGDFYVNSAAQLCSPDRLADYRSSGTYGDSYACCYFPAIEGLVMLHRATHDARYLEQAKRMAALFGEFDVLPVDHSHGNLCAWRGILDLYGVTHDRQYLAGAIAKWEAAVRGGYVWPIGGIGEHWYVSFGGDEGCSESDWLRFNLELWRHTGNTRYLDMTERLLGNQYVENQCATGGFGWRAFEADPAGPYGTHGPVQEWNFCCSFHGPLGLHFLKGYLAAGEGANILVNFAGDFDAPVQVGRSEWRVRVRTAPDWQAGSCASTVTVSPANARPSPITLRMRMPAWASSASVTGPRGASIKAAPRAGYLTLATSLTRAATFAVRFAAPLRAEGRRFARLQARASQVARLADVTLLVGPRVLSVLPARSAGRPVVLATVDGSGRLDLLRGTSGQWRSVPLPSIDASPDQIWSALASAQPLQLLPHDGVDRRRSAFAVDLVVVPSALVPAEARRRIARCTPPTAHTGPVYGDNLERQPEAWDAPGAWRFTDQGIMVDGGDIGLIGGRGYVDCRFEFDVRIPESGNGLAGWVVRAQDNDNCVMYQLQTADSPYSAPEFKTRPNTLRPHSRRNGAWVIDDPILLPKPVRRGETHHVAVECRGSRVTVFLDGDRVHERDDAGWHQGGVGFRAGGAGEAGEFSRISLHKLP